MKQNIYIKEIAVLSNDDVTMIIPSNIPLPLFVRGVFTVRVFLFWRARKHTRRKREREREREKEKERKRERERERENQSLLLPPAALPLPLPPSSPSFSLSRPSKSDLSVISLEKKKLPRS
jgi:hypothetical protein